MTDDHEHPANGPKQEITSEAAEFAAEQAEQTEPEPGEAPEIESVEDAVPRAESQFAGRAATAEHEAPAKLERLQKILAQAGIASRRHAEELITQGRVQVNGQTVTVLGTKADPDRDHIRVDGKLLRGAERLRYFVLNKPKGFVTTVTDPEGRPTVMQFFAKTNERLYPVGRLDYLSEGLLLVTNDGELANQLTRAASGVEKTYLVKVAGQPSEEQLDRLRGGVSIDKGGPREGKVHTAAASIRQIRKGDNPWYEVILIEGRNRELRKMFEEIGHHVEKIRRVGYGPLVLDVEPGKIRELATEEVEALRLTAAGKLKPRRPKATRMLPKVAGKRADVGEERPRRFDRPPAGERREGRFEWTGKPDTRPKFGSRPASPFVKSDRPGRNRSASDRPYQDRPVQNRPVQDRPIQDRPFKGRPFKDRTPRPPGDRREPFGRPEDSRGARGGPPRGAGFGERRPPRPGGRPNADASPRTFEGRRPERAAGFRDRSSERSGPPRKSFGARGPGSGAQRSEGRGQRSPEFRGGRKPYGAGPQRRESGERPQRRDEGAKPFRDNRRPPSDRPTGRESSERPQRREGGTRPFRPEQRPFGKGPARSEGSPRREGPARPFRGDRKPGPPFRGKPGGKPGGRPSGKPGGGPKRSSARPGGKRNFGKRPK